jgi:poly-gamma-glutamate synthesis protein (capsule biosynthesis protein)
MDYGSRGLSDTLAACASYKIQTVGAGMSLESASKPLFVERDGLRLAIVNFAENEWASATMEGAGANPYDIIKCSHLIKSAAKQSDHVLVVIHGGHEHYNLPSPRMVKEYRFFAESGASAVISHHSHIISGYEIYGGVPIFYGLGNFLFTRKKKLKSWYSGLCVSLYFLPGQQVSFKLSPVTQSRDDFSVYMPVNGEQSVILSDVERLSTIISDSALLRDHWDRFVASIGRQYLSLRNPLNTKRFRLGFRVLRKLGLDSIFLCKEDLSELLNYVRCESHADLLIEALTNELN